MMSTQQAISSPSGISVFGSALLRVPADLAVLSIATHGLNQDAQQAFDQVHVRADAVSKFLRAASAREVATSRVTLRQEFRFSGGEQRFVGYLARIGFQISLRDLTQLERTLSGAVAAGANEVVSVDFQTTELQAHRAEARKRAVRAAREKALVYAEAAGITLGPVIHLEDMNPDVLTGVRSGHAERSMPTEDGALNSAVNPGDITVGAAVVVVYAIGAQSAPA